MKIKIKLILFTLLISFVSFGNVLAQDNDTQNEVVSDSPTGTIIPKVGDKSYCNQIINSFNTDETIGSASQLVGCALTTGRVSLAMIPYFIKYFSDFLLGLVSIISVLFVVIGGFYYSFGSMTGSKDKGKTFIKNAIIGMCIAFLAWGIVNVIIATLTS